MHCPQLSQQFDYGLPNRRCLSVRPKKMTFTYKVVFL